MLETALPRYALDLATPPPDRLTRLFAAPVSEAWLEIGFGAGEHLLWQADQHPGVGLIGCEPFQDGIVKVLAALEDRAEPQGKIRLHAGDAREVIGWLPPGSVARVFILFPDPWPKRRHWKRRLVQPGFLARLAGVMRPGGTLRIATDIDDYVRTSLIAAAAEPRLMWCARRPSDWRRQDAEWPATRYEEKARAAGRTVTVLNFRRSEDRTTPAEAAPGMA